MVKQKRKLIEKLLFEVYDKGLQQEECNLTAYYEKIMQALNIPFVSNMLPLPEKETEILNKTFKRLISKTPTKL